VNVLITGGTGFVGSHLCEKLHQRGHEVWVLDIEDNWIKEIAASTGRVTWFKGTVVDDDLVKGVLLNARPEEIVHLAGVSHTVSSALGQRSALEPGVMGLATIQDVIRQLCEPGRLSKLQEPPRISIASSSLCSGMFAADRQLKKGSGFVSGVANDASKIDLNDCYHQYVDNKLMMEMLCHSNRYQFGQPFTIFRFGTLYGPRMNPNVVTWYFIRNALLKTPMIVHGDGKQVRQHFYVEDLVDGIVKILENRQKFLNKTVSIVPDHMSSVWDIAQAVTKAVPDARIECVQSRSIDVKVKQIAMPDDLVELGWRPRFSLEEGIAKTVEFYRNCMELVRGGADERIKETN